MKIKAFEEFHAEYEQWFEDNRFIYLSELAAIKQLLPKYESGVEIGSGTGRFSLPLGIKTGVDPSPQMRKIARAKGMNVLDGTAEQLPFKDKSLDLALMITTICFVDDPERSLLEINRVLKPNGSLILGFIDKSSPLGKIYQAKKDRSRFYKEAAFFSTKEIKGLLKKAGFSNLITVQTIFTPIEKITSAEPVQKGHGQGSFIAIRAENITS